MDGSKLRNTLVRWTMTVTISLIGLIALSPVTAATLADVDFDDRVTVEGKELVLNGMGLRTATAFKVKIYAIGLYLENKSSDSDAIMSSTENKRITMHFLHKVTADELSGGWSEGFENNTQDISGIKDQIAKFNASMRDVKTGDTIVLDFSGNKVDVLINDKQIDSVEGEAFLKALLAIWLGPKPPNEPLKQGILGASG
jgi:hypothetical protein